MSDVTGVSDAAAVGDGASADVGAGASEVVLRTVEDGVAVLTLNRPERLNAWTHEMESLYFDAARRVRARGIGPRRSS